MDTRIAKAIEVTTPADYEIVLTRSFDAPRQKVFAAWTESAQLTRWFGPKNFAASSVEADVRPGGFWRICIRSPDGQDYWMHGVYREIVAPERLVFTHVWEDGHGASGHETLVTLTFEEAGSKTIMTFHKAVLMSAGERDAQQAGWSECLDRLGAYLAGLPFVA